MTEQLISLELIDPNPKQKRFDFKREKVLSIAFSIATDGMLQTPTGRWVGKRFQSAIGHTRTESYRLNAQIQKALSNGKHYPEDVSPEHIEAVKTAVADGKDFAKMKWVVEELTDEQMFRYATIENNQRENLSPVEQIDEMKGWVDFGYNSKQIAALYPGMSDSTVRGLLALDDLVDEGKAALHKGTISQGTARLLKSVQRIAPKAKVVEMIKKVESQANKRMPEQVLEEMVNHLDNVVELWNQGQRDGKPRAGYHGWPLDMKKFPNQMLPRMNEQQAGAFEQQLEHLVNPPACNACPFYTKIRGTHFCGMKFCFQRKSVAWEAYMVEQASKQSKIEIYDDEDGAYKPLDAYGRDAKLFEKRDKGLRLLPAHMLGRSIYQGFKGLDDDLVVVIATGETLNKMQNTGSVAKGGKKTEKEKAEMRMMKIYRICRKELLWEFTACAKSVFDAVPYEILLKIHHWKFIGVDDNPPADVIIADNAKVDDTKKDYFRRLLIWQMIIGDSSHYRRQTMDLLLQDLQEHAKAWGVKIPKALIKKADEWDAEIQAVGAVSTATKGKTS